MIDVQLMYSYQDQSKTIQSTFKHWYYSVISLFWKVTEKWERYRIAHTIQFRMS